MRREIGLSANGLRATLRIMMAETGTASFADIARAIDMKETTLRAAIANESLRVTDLEKIAAWMGYELKAYPLE